MCPVAMTRVNKHLEELCEKYRIFEEKKDFLPKNFPECTCKGSVKDAL